MLEAVDVEQLVESIRAIDENKGLASPEMIRAFMSRLNALSKLCADIDSLSVLLDELTPREKEVLDLLREGKSNQDIADDLCIEVGTVKNHLHNILKKLFRLLPADALHPHQYSLPDYVQLLEQHPFTILKTQCLKQSLIFGYWVIVAQKNGI